MLFIAAVLGNESPFIVSASGFCTVERKEIFGEIKELRAKFARGVSPSLWVDGRKPCHRTIARQDFREHTGYLAG